MRLASVILFMLGLSLVAPQTFLMADALQKCKETSTGCKTARPMCDQIGSCRRCTAAWLNFTCQNDITTCTPGGGVDCGLLEVVACNGAAGCPGLGWVPTGINCDITATSCF